MPSHFFSNDLVRSRRIIHQPSRFAVESLLYLQETGSLSAVKPHVSSRRGLDSFLFFIVTEGEGTVAYGGREHIVSKGDCVFIDCRTEYSQCSSEENLWSLKWIHFNGSAMKGIYSKFLERGGSCVIRNCDEEKFSGVLDSVYETASSFSYVRDMIINQTISSLLTLIMEQSWNPSGEKMNSTKSLDTNAVKKYIDEFFSESISLEDVARKFNVNKSYLLRSFREDFGITVNNYILQQRILFSKNSLRFSGKTLDAIAQECGFGDANYFIRQFKKSEGITPGEYRKTW